MEERVELIPESLVDEQEKKEEQVQETATTPQAEESTEIQPYTNEEFLDKDFLDMDVNRLTPEQAKLYRKHQLMDRDYTKKTQQLGEITRNAPQPQQDDPLFREFVQDPRKMLNDINYRSKVAMESQDYETAYKLNQIKDDLILRGQALMMNNIQSQVMPLMQQVAEQRANLAVSQRIPNFMDNSGNINPDVVQKLVNHARTKMGYSQENIQYIAQSPANIRAEQMSVIYEDMKRNEKAATAKKPKKATKVESAGTGTDEKTSSSWSFNDYAAMRMKGLK